MNEIELEYDAKKGVTNLDQLENLNTIPSFKQRIQNIIKTNINNGYQTRNIRKVCFLSVISIIILVIVCTILTIILYPNGFGFIAGTIAGINGIIIYFCLYRKSIIKFLVDAQKKIQNQTMNSCKLEIHINSKPFKESKGCLGVTLGNNSFIFISSDPEKLEEAKLQMIRDEEELRLKNKLEPQVQKILRQHSDHNGLIPVNVLDKDNQMVENFHVENQLLQRLVEPDSLNDQNSKERGLVSIDQRGVGLDNDQILSKSIESIEKKQKLNESIDLLGVDNKKDSMKL